MIARRFVTVRRLSRYLPIGLAVAACATPHLALATSFASSVASPFTTLLTQIMQFGGWTIAGVGVAALGGGILGQQKDPKHSEMYHHLLNYAGGASLGGLLVALGGPALVTSIQTAVGGAGALLH